MIAVVAPFFFIFFYMFWNSLKPDYLFFEPGTWIFDPLWSNYTEVFEYSDLIPQHRQQPHHLDPPRPSSASSAGCLPAYTVARYNLRRLAMAILVTRMIPYITAPRAVLDRLQARGPAQHLHRGSSSPTSSITIPFGVWIMMGFIEDIPKDLEEAAWIDGALAHPRRSFASCFP